VRVVQLGLRDFRNYERLVIEPDDGLNLFIGQNAQGKTNLLEAVFCLACGRSYRSYRDEELIRWRQPAAFLMAWVSRRTGKNKIDIALSRQKSKVIRVNDNQLERIGELPDYLNVVTFSPDDLQLVKGSPSRRRGFLDAEISQVSASYRVDLANYNKILQQRNKVLRNWWSEGSRPKHNVLSVYDEQLIETGIRIVVRREKALRKLAILSRLTHRQMTGGSENLELRYVPFWHHLRTDDCPGLDEEPSVEEVRERFEDALRQVAAHERRRGVTLTGPQRDDILFSVDGMNLRRFGSQGQQRTAVLACKMAELEFVRSEAGEYPVMLLDDVMSELDASRRQYFLEAIGQKVQVFLTSTSARDFNDDILGKARLYTIQAGTISEQAC